MSYTYVTTKYITPWCYYRTNLGFSTTFCALKSYGIVTKGISFSGNRNGTCFTSSECSQKGGSQQGNCAAGFGVCCVFTLTDQSGQVNQNCTYIQNPGYPQSYTSVASVSYTINKCANGI